MLTLTYAEFLLEGESGTISRSVAVTLLANVCPCIGKAYHAAHIILRGYYMLCRKSIAESLTLQKMSSDEYLFTNVIVAVSKMSAHDKKGVMVAYSHPNLKNEGQILVTICEEQ